MNANECTPEEKNKLWAYTEKWLHTACEKFDEKEPQIVMPLIQILSVIVQVYRGDDFSKKLTHSFL